MPGKLLTQKGLFSLLLVYFGLQVVIRTLLTPTLDLDEAEQVFFSQWWLLGYGPQPPLYNWLQHGLFELIGTHIFALALLKNALLFFTYLFVYLSAKNLLNSEKWAAVATLWLLLLPQIAWEAQRDLSHSVIVTSCSAMCLYTITEIIKHSSWRHYAWLGLSGGLLMLSKYNGIIFLVPMALAIASMKEHRHRLFSPKVLLAITVAIVLITPHYSWLLQHVEQASSSSLNKLSGGGSQTDRPIYQGIFSLLEAVILFCLLPVLTSAIIYGFKPWFNSASSPCTVLFERFFIFFIALLIIISTATGANEFKDRWMLPALFWLPIYLIAKVQLYKKQNTPSIKPFFAPITLMVFIPLIITARVIWSSDLENKERLNIPYISLVEQLKNNYPTADMILSTDSRQGGNLHFQWQALPALAIDKPEYGHSIIESKSNILFVWRADKSHAMPSIIEAFINQGEWQWDDDAVYREFNYFYFSRKTATWGSRLLIRKK